MDPHGLHSIPVTEIIPNLYLGSYHDSYLQESLHFDILVSALSVPEYRMLEVEALPNVEWHKLIIEDTEENEIRNYFTKIHAILRNGLREGKRILVHCAAGKSRSATLVMAYLIMENEWTRKEAYEYVSRKRMIIEPNEGFMSQLKALEQIVLQTKSDSHEE